MALCIYPLQKMVTHIFLMILYFQLLHPGLCGVARLFRGTVKLQQN